MTVTEIESIIREATRVDDPPQGYDDGVVYGGFEAALAEFIVYGTLPHGVRQPDPDGALDPQEALIESLSNAGTVGSGEPVAYVGVDVYFTLICEGASREEIAMAARDCLEEVDHATD